LPTVKARRAPGHGLENICNDFQLATMLFAADKSVNKYTVFIAASAALVVASAIGVLAGSLLSEYIDEKYLHYVAGTGFILIGAYTLYSA